jgi:hypothetical protein
MLVSGSALKTYNLEVRRALCRGESAGEGFAVQKIVRICRSGFMTSYCEFFLCGRTIATWSLPIDKCGRYEDLCGSDH